jgi:hypothetical protein
MFPCGKTCQEQGAADQQENKLDLTYFNSICFVHAQIIFLFERDISFDSSQLWSSVAFIGRYG